MNKRMNGKIAVLISGPVRYVTLVNQRLQIVLRDCEYDCFYHLWSADLGNKIRGGVHYDYTELHEHPRTKVLIVQSPYSEDSFAGTIGTETGSNSTINATMGMFFSVSLLCNYLRHLPDFENYKYVLRLRTDCAILNDDFLSLLNPDPYVLTVSKSYFIQDDWISDHICFGSVEHFFKLWCYSGMNQIYEAYKTGDRNPEVTLTRRYQQNLTGVSLNPSIIRFRDYHIVYYPTRDCDPGCINRAINHSGIENFFLNGSAQIDLTEVDEFNAAFKAKWKKLESSKQNDTTTNLVPVPSLIQIKEGPRFSFVMIVLNGMPFIEYSLKSIYEFAHEVIIVEGAVEKCMFAANPDGSSTDGTVEFLKSFPDPQRKIKLIQGRWPEKCEMQNEALRHFIGDYVWLIDSDEVYKKEHLDKTKKILKDDPSITQVNFIPDNFWKGLDYIFVSSRFFEPACHYRRLFKYVPGAVFTSHRPPTMMWPNSERTTEQIHLLDGHTTREMGIIPYHYSYALHEQVRQKIELYHRYGWGKDWKVDLLEWYKECFLKWTPEHRHAIEEQYPVWAGDRKSRTQLFTGTHPEVMDGFRDKLIVRMYWPEERTLPVIGDPYYQKKVVQAWNFIEIDAPVQKRRDLMLQNIEGDNFFWNIHVALAFLADRLQPKNYLEIGVRTGCSLVPVLHNSAIQEVVAIDMWEGSYASIPNTKEYTENQINVYKSKTNRQFRIDFIQGDSHRHLKELVKLGKKFDLITVDGDHMENGAWEDLEDAARLLAETGAIVFDDIIHPSHSNLRKLIDRFCKLHSDYTVLINSRQDNGCAILLKGIDAGELLTEKHSNVSGNRGKQVRVAADYVRSGTQIETESSFGAEIRELFAKIKPRKIIETGTYLGTGTTTIIDGALKAQDIHDAIFYTIEVNPQNYARAKEYFMANNMNVQALNGLSVPRSMLPNKDQIARRTITDVDYDGIFVDHKEESRVKLYYDETDFPQVEDNLIYKCLKRFDFRPDFVLLDSAGHMGSIEFDYLIDNLQAECYIALDDIYHVKHHRSFQRIQSDPRFEIFTSSKEKFGFCIAKFTPESVRETIESDYTASDDASAKKVLIVRTDSIGDFVIFSGALPSYKKIYPNAHIAIVVPESVAELAEVCPFIDEVMTFNRWNILNQSGYADEFIFHVRNKKFDVVICPAFSRDKVSDYIAINSGAVEKITCSGDTANLPDGIIKTNNTGYTKIVPMSEGISLETLRNGEFLRGLGVEINGPYRSTVWITKADEDAVHQLLDDRAIKEPMVIAPFAQQDIRNWPLENWAKLVSAYTGVPIVICGMETDKPSAEKIIRLADHPSIHNLCGSTTVRHLAALIARSRICISSESAAAHLAAAVNRPHVVLVGGGHFGRFMPYSLQTAMVYNRMDCYNCNWQCMYGRDIRCIASISVDMVEQAVNKVLGKARSICSLLSSEAANLHEEDVAGESDFRVSAIVSTYNSEKFLRGCLDDLERQTIADKLEIIVVNSGSQENEEAIVLEYQREYDNIVYLKTDRREGIYTAWNRAVKVARGRFLTNANTDDRHREDALERMAETLLTNPDVALVYGDQICTDTPNGSFAHHHATEMAQRPEFSRERLLYGCCVGSQPMWRKSLHDEFGCFDDTLTCAGDWDFWLRISSKHKFKHLPECLGLYYNNESGIEHGRKIHSLYERYKVGRRYGNPYISVIPLYRSGDNPLVSVIMPAYNAADYIAEAIESVLIQNYRNFELIVVDDGSTDETKNIIAGFKDNKIRYFCKEKSGPASARNVAIKKSVSDFIAFLDADDMMTPDFLSKHLQEFDKHSEADLVYCDDSLTDKNLKTIRVIQRPEYTNRKSLIRDMFRCGFPIIPFRTCIKSRVFERIGLFDENLLVGEDYDMMRRFIKHGLKIHHLKDALYLRRMTDESLSRSPSRQKLRCHFDVVKRFVDTFTYDELFPDVMWNEIPQDDRQVHAKCLVVSTYLAMGEDFLQSNSPRFYVKMAFEEACLQLRQCLEIVPNNWKIRQLLHKCELGRRKYDDEVQHRILPSHVTTPQQTDGNTLMPKVSEGDPVGMNMSN